MPWWLLAQLKEARLVREGLSQYSFMPDPLLAQLKESIIQCIRLDHNVFQCLRRRWHS